MKFHQIVTHDKYSYKPTNLKETSKKVRKINEESFSKLAGAPFHPLLDKLPSKIQRDIVSAHRGISKLMIAYNKLAAEHEADGDLEEYESVNNDIGTWGKVALNLQGLRLKPASTWFQTKLDSVPRDWMYTGPFNSDSIEKVLGDDDYINAVMNMLRKLKPKQPPQKPSKYKLDTDPLITENMSDWLNAGIAEPLAKKILRNYKFKNTGEFTDVKKPKASELRRGDLFLGDGGKTVIFVRKSGTKIAYKRISMDDQGKIDDSNPIFSVSQAFKGVKGPWKKLQGAVQYADAGARDRGEGGQAVPPSDILGGDSVPAAGWLPEMNKMYFKRLKPKLDAMVNEIFAGLRTLPGEGDGRYNSSARHEAMTFANRIEEISRNGFTEKTAEGFLISIGKHTGGYGSAYDNRDELNKLMSTHKGRAMFAQHILDSGKEHLEHVRDLQDEYNGVNASVKKLQGETEAS